MTPETDAAVIASNGQWSFVLKETCQRLERERDEWAALCGQYKAGRDEAKDALAAAKDRIKELEGQVSYARHERNKALNEIDEYKATFDVRWQAQMRAVTRWQEETKQETMWPGHEDLCLWLIRKLEAAK